MAEVEIKVGIGDHTEIVPKNIFFDHVAVNYTDKKDLYCAELDPPISLSETEVIKYVHFQNFVNFGRSLNFFTGAAFRLPDNVTSLTLKLITPVAIPMNKRLNSKLNSLYAEISAHIFFLPHLKNQVEDLEYLNSISSNWNDLISKIEMILKQSGKGEFGISVGIMETEGIVPFLTPIESFFSMEKSYEAGASNMIIIVGSLDYMTFNVEGEFVSAENVPQIPKDIITRIFYSEKNNNNSFTTTERRMIKSCLNGGIPVNFLNLPDISIYYEENRKLKLDDFDQIELHFGDFDRISNEIVDKLESFIENLKDHLFAASSEAAMRLLFWDPVINRMLQHGQEGSVKHYLIEPEWNTGSFFEDLRDQRVDSAVTFNLGGKIYPMLLIEVGKEPFDLKSPHKDQSKLLGILSQSCINLAYGLIEAKKQPEAARTCGVWIGGPVVQLLTAHPVFTKRPDGIVDIHTNITLNSHWIYDLRINAPINQCDKICCKPSSDGIFKFEIIKQGELKLEGYNFFAVPEKPRVRDTLLNEPEDVSIRKLCSSQSSISTGGQNKLVPGEINPDILKKLNFFIQYAKQRISFLLSEESNARNDERNFGAKGKFRVLVESRGSSAAKTPKKRMTIVASSQRGNSSPTRSGFNSRTVLIKKNSLKELEILLKLAKFPNNFPVVYDFSIKSDGDQIISYEFEYMEEIAVSSRIFVHESSLGLFYSALTFALDCLYGTYILHEAVGVIHSDISLNNIMFSYVHETWKLIDFDHSLEVSESLRTKRAAGTPGYIAPEALESGIFTKESDVFSLGQVLMKLFDIIIMRQITVNEDDEEITDDIREFGHQFGLILRAMTHPNPSYRPSVIRCIEQIYEIVEGIGFIIDEVKYSPIKMLLKQNRDIGQLQKGFEKVNVEKPFEISTKRVRVTEEKEQIFSGIQTIE